MLFGMRFDFRNPEIAGTAMADRYAAALDMCEWADGLGCVSIAVSEHHGSADGYLPSPLPMLGAMAARTSNVRFMVAALIAPFYDPLRLAEDMVVLDHLSRGRIDLVIAGGYVPDEFAMYGVPTSQRAARVTETIETLRAAFRGEPFEYRGRIVEVTPPPYRPGGPALLLGGTSEPAARRAARIADGFIPSVPEAWDFYRDEVQVLGRPDPGPSPVGKQVTVALAEDADAGWEQVAPFFLHETNTYGAYQQAADIDSPYYSCASADELRARGTYRVVTPDEFVNEQKAAPFAFAMFHPMCGGIPPELAWSSLRLFETEVLPAFA
jgi:alkanesulfonate monooxygenase SsuD/methylene tetrahydromethanopterin reductase-like flavin-dependent oxidoreductase (luciferase family)